MVNEPGGTGGASRLPGIIAAGKTGTAQVVALGKKAVAGSSRDHAWFVAFAPLESPEIAVAVLVEHGGHGGEAAAPIARKLFAAYFSLAPKASSVPKEEEIRESRIRRRRTSLIDRRLIQNFDWYLILFTLTLIIIGVLNIYSATYQTEEGLRTPIYMKQIYWAAIGLLFLIVVVVFDYHLLLSLAYPLYGVSVALLLGVLLFGRSISGSQRWITIASFSFQPSELIKIALILALAKYFSQNEKPVTLRPEGPVPSPGPGSVPGPVDHEAAGSGNSAVTAAGGLFDHPVPGSGMEDPVDLPGGAIGSPFPFSGTS